MLNARVHAPALADFASFAMPPNRPPRSERRSEGSRSVARRLIRSIRTSFSAAADEPGTAWLPRLNAYPY